MLHTTVALKPF